MAIGFNLSNTISGAGADVYIDNIKVALNEIRLKTGNIMPSSLPHNFVNGSAVVYNNEIHILGSDQSGNQNKHYKWNGTSWTIASTLPYEFYDGSAFVYNDEIHIIGGPVQPYYHYKFNASSWTSLSYLPYGFKEGSAVVYNNEIHILGSGYPNTTIMFFILDGYLVESMS